MTVPDGWLPTVVEIDLGALAHNVRAIRARLRPDCGLMAVVKADAYGHGAVPLAQVALHHGASWLGVARPEEGVALRQAGITAPILVFSMVWPQAMATVLEHRLTPVVGSVAEVTALQHAAAQQGLTYPIHVKIDTGMGRLGARPDDVPALLAHVARCPHLSCEGLMTHLACADTPDVDSVERQLARFQSVQQQCTQRGLTPRYVHAANSAGLYRYPASHGTLVRAGIALYGALALDERGVERLRPVLTWKTHIARVQALPAGCGISYGHTFITHRPSVIGTLPVGYADGLKRVLSNVGQVLIHEQHAPIVGRICMDMCMVDLTDVPDVQVGDEAVLLGTQGQAQISAATMAAQCDTIAYEIFCGITQRIPRRYLEADA